MIGSTVHVVTAGVGVVASIAHAVSFHMTAVGTPTIATTSLPFHFSWSGAPSVWLGWKWMALYPVLVTVEASLLGGSNEHHAKDINGDAQETPKMKRLCSSDDYWVLSSAIVVTIIAQVWAGKIALGQQTQMPAWLPKALVLAVVVPATLKQLV
jgi:hypothetical protein